MEDARESKIRHLEMISNIISRMASNSLAIKGLCITLIAAIIALNFTALYIFFSSFL